MLVILLITSMFSQALSAVSCGDNFITAFPENLGFFYPVNPWNALRVTALYDNTSFTVFHQGSQKDLQIQTSGQSMTVVISGSTEVTTLGSSDLSVRITSDKNITVVSQSMREGSTQINVVQPIVNLGTNYLIPLLAYPGYLESFNLPDQVSSTARYSSFKLIIINAVDGQNNITIVKQTSADPEEETFNLDSYQLIQLQTNGSILRVKSTKEVAVILTHPCLETPDCNCNLITNQILPANFSGHSFIVPSIFNISETKLLVLSENSSVLYHNGDQLQASSSTLLAFSDLQTSQLVNTSDGVSLRLVSPGLVVELIPENMFAACYLLQFNWVGGKAVVVAETASKDDVNTNEGLLSAAEWTAVAGTNYSSTVVTLSEQTATIWHPTAKIAVYTLESMSGNVMYGGPAIPICEKPDLHGCMLIPGVYIVGQEPLSWQQSREYCMSIGNQFACPVSQTVQQDMAANLTAEDGQGWIGLRRSLMTLDWYWQDEYEPPTSVSYVHWADGQPLDYLKGLCTSMSLDPTNNFQWQSDRCCDEKKPVCFKRPLYLNLSQNWFMESAP